MNAAMPTPILNPCSAGGLPPSRRALLLDRDGVINVNFGYVHTPETTEWVEGIDALCVAAQSAGFGLVVVTNQAGIGRGLYTESQFADYTAWMLRQLSARGIDILRVYYCPHHPTAGQGIYRAQCACRKPAPGMILAAARDLGIDLAGSVMMGDKASDMQAALAAGVGRCIQIDDPLDARLPGVAYVRDLSQAREVLLGA
ncbi:MULTISPECIES: HAD family hydrolase [Stenotrophomonas]|uniref:D-glycero-alpha-D-manno-heptose-1,7-bisphosphate 7-phosphatase n=1 Tax=Stenotrophomonas TaxID=40323 RepID=UPI0019010409|nr:MULTISPECIES: HAD family hydrolase [Stenotrophomonas]